MVSGERLVYAVACVVAPGRREDLRTPTFSLTADHPSSVAAARSAPRCRGAGGRRPRDHSACPGARGSYHPMCSNRRGCATWSRASATPSTTAAWCCSRWRSRSRAQTLHGVQIGAAGREAQTLFGGAFGLTPLSVDLNPRRTASQTQSRAWPRSSRAVASYSRWRMTGVDLTYADRSAVERPPWVPPRPR